MLGPWGKSTEFMPHHTRKAGFSNVSSLGIVTVSLIQENYSDSLSLHPACMFDSISIFAKFPMYSFIRFVEFGCVRGGGGEIHVDYVYYICNFSRSHRFDYDYSCS